jgi:hypothetical protein
MRPLFIFGIARSGTSLLARLLAAHPAVEVALDPFMPVLKTLRNATLRAAAQGDALDPAAPFQDGYLRPHGYRLLDLLLEADLGAPIEAGEIAVLRAAVAQRAAFEAPDIAEGATALAGDTCRALLESALDLVARSRRGAATRWIGIKEVWTLDFLPALARAFPEAKFVAIERDPRAVIASLASLAAQDASQHAHPISYLRHWRKGVALARRYLTDHTLTGRFHLVRYEALATQPEIEAERLAGFLDLPFDRRMLSPGAANASHEQGIIGISARSIGRWRRSPLQMIRAVEFFCAPEMILAEDDPEHAPASATAEIIDYLRRADGDPGSWRSDSGDVAAEIAGEMLRRHLLGLAEACADTDLVRRCFLFEATYRAIRGALAEQRREMARSDPVEAIA